MIKDQISNNKIRQIFLLVVILLLLFLIVSHLQEFLPSAFGAITLYVICRDFHLYLVEKRKWKSWLSSIFLMLITILIIIVPIYFIIDTLVSKILNSGAYVDMVVRYAELVHIYVRDQIGYDISKSLDIKKISEWLTSSSSYFLSETINMFTKVSLAYFILYFMLTNSRSIERRIYEVIPLKKANIEKIGTKFQKMILANVIGIPIVATGQGLTLLIAYLLFDVSSPFFLFILTSIASVIPIVGGAIVYIPVALTLLVSGNTIGAIGIIIFGLISGAMDNVFRFTFLKKMEDIHPLNSVFGIILGLNLFGFIGLVFGPILISITILMIKVYHNEFANNRVSRKVLLLNRKKNIMHRCKKYKN